MAKPKKPVTKPKGAISQITAGPPSGGTGAKKKRKPIGVPDDYLLPGQNRPLYNLPAGVMGPVPHAATPVGPRYYEGDELNPASMTVEDRARWQMRLVNVGLLKPEDVNGVWTAASKKAYKELLSIANAAGLDREQALAQFPTEYKAQVAKANRGGGGGRGGRGGGAGASNAQIEGLMAQIKDRGREFSVSLSDPAARSFASKMAAGSIGQDTIDQHFITQAKSRFGNAALGSALDRGFTVKEYADQYINDASQILEINPEQVDLSDPKWSRFLDHRNEKGEPVGMDRYQWITTLKSDPIYDWRHTKGANEEASATAEGLARIFGKRG